MKRLVIIYISLLCSLTVNAEQLFFQKKELDNSFEFSYQWLDHQDKKRKLTFALTKKTLFERFRNFRTFQPNIATQAINKKVFNAWQKSPVKDSELSFKKRHGNYELILRSETKKAKRSAAKQLAKLTETAKQEYLDENFYQTFITPDKNLAIKPDHTKIARLSVDDFKTIKPIILENVDLKNIRTATNYILNFSQAIPYSTLSSRVTSSGAGFNPPTQLIWENQGDCDSKVTLTASILRSLMPRIKMVLVFIDNHALIGIDAMPQNDDITLEYDGTTFVLGEPTGPAMLPLGKLAQDSEQAILNGMYTLEKFYKDDT